jgi:chloride channel 7
MEWSPADKKAGEVEMKASSTDSNNSTVASPSRRASIKRAESEVKSLRMLGTHVQKQRRMTQEEVVVVETRKKMKAGAQKYESFDYDAAETQSRKMIDSTLDGTVAMHSNTQKAKWALTVIIGFMMGLTAYIMTWLLGTMVHWKHHHILHYIADNEFTKAYGFNMLVVVVCSIIATAFTNYAPASAGSGIPMVKAYLNGNHIKGVIRYQTLLAKFFGVLACCLAGMPAGREGPMVHLGAIIAAGLAKGQSKLFPKGLDCFHYGTFNDVASLRDFVSIGAAAGVAAAFNAPVGGILFSLEEVSSFWSGHHMYGVFIAATMASFSLKTLLTISHNDESVTDAGLILFGRAGEFEEFSLTNFKTWELILFAALGVGGGILGAGFCFFNKHLTWKRKAFYAWADKGWASGPNAAWSSAGLKCTLSILETVVTLVAVTSIFFVLPFGFDCLATTDVADDHILDHAGAHGLSPIQYDCNDHYYNDMATLVFNPGEACVIQLFSRSTHGYFQIKTLAVFILAFFPCACYCYGLFVPAGLFVPSLMTGAAIGRLIGELLHTTYPTIDPGLYSLVGAAALLGGITRMTISLAVILVELTNDINFLLPILLTLIISKMTGDMLEESIYDIHMMKMAGVPYLEEEPPEDAGFRTAQDVMKSHVVCMSAISKVADIQTKLEECTHNGFPVIEGGVSGEDKTFLGVISREKLELIISDPDLHLAATTPARAAGRASAAPRLGSIVESSDTVVNPMGNGVNGIKEPLVDLSRHMDPSPFIVRESLPLDRTYRLFTKMGIRHLVVLQQGLFVAGIITRKDFAYGVAAPMREQGSAMSIRYIRDTSLRTATANHSKFQASKRAGGQMTGTRAHASTI